MAFHFPLMPRMFMALRHGGPAPHHRHPGADAGPARDGPVGPLPAQPRRAHARDGHRRGARLHVPRLRGRPAGAHQPGHPPPPGAAAGQRPPPPGAHERAALLAAGHTGHLLRRRDRHGRQRLPARPQRRAHADAVVRRTATPASRPRRPAAPLPARRHRRRVPLRGRQRGGPAVQPAVRCCGGCGASSRCASDTPPSGAARCASCTPATVASWPSSARTATRRSSWSPTCRATPSGPSWTSAPYAGQVPVELFGAVEFPRIGSQPYLVNLGPHSFLWFRLARDPLAGEGPAWHEGDLPELRWRGDLAQLLRRPGEQVADVLLRWMLTRSWYRGAARPCRRPVSRRSWSSRR